MLVIAIIAFAAIFNTLLATRLHLVEGTILVVHVFGFFCVLVPLWVLSPRTDSKDVWTTFHDPGWNNSGLSTLIGLITCVLPLLGADASGKQKLVKEFWFQLGCKANFYAVHMAEEVQDAARTLPKAMMWSINLNGMMGWLTAITFCYCIGDLDEGKNSRRHFFFAFLAMY